MENEETSNKLQMLFIALEKIVVDADKRIYLINDELTIFKKAGNYYLYTNHDNTDSVILKSKLFCFLDFHSDGEISWKPNDISHSTIEDTSSETSYGYFSINNMFNEMNEDALKLWLRLQ